MDMIITLKPDILIKGGDYNLEDIVGHQEVLSSGGKVETIPMLKGYSSSSIIDRKNP